MKCRYGLDSEMLFASDPAVDRQFMQIHVLLKL